MYGQRAEALRVAHESQYREEVKTTPTKTTETPVKTSLMPPPKSDSKHDRATPSKDRIEAKSSSSPSVASLSHISTSPSSSLPTDPTSTTGIIRPIRKRKLEEDDEVSGTAASVLKYFTPEGMLY
ncbi:hypothetical protein EON65_38880, partial [archaeon]